MIPYEELVTALTTWRERQGLAVAGLDYLGAPPAKPTHFIDVPDVPTPGLVAIEDADDLVVAEDGSDQGYGDQGYGDASDAYGDDAAYADADAAPYAESDSGGYAAVDTGAIDAGDAEDAYAYQAPTHDIDPADPVEGDDDFAMSFGGGDVPPPLAEVEDAAGLELAYGEDEGESTMIGEMPAAPAWQADGGFEPPPLAPPSDADGDHDGDHDDDAMAYAGGEVDVDDDAVLGETVSFEAGDPDGGAGVDALPGFDEGGFEPPPLPDFDPDFDDGDNSERTVVGQPGSDPESQ